MQRAIAGSIPSTTPGAMHRTFMESQTVVFKPVNEQVEMVLFPQATKEYPQKPIHPKCSLSHSKSQIPLKKKLYFRKQCCLHSLLTTDYFSALNLLQPSNLCPHPPPLYFLSSKPHPVVNKCRMYNFD